MASAGLPPRSWQLFSTMYGRSLFPPFLIRCDAATYRLSGFPRSLARRYRFTVPALFCGPLT